MRPYKCQILTAVAWLFFMTAVVLVLSFAHGLWTGWLFSPGLKGPPLPYHIERDPIMYWMAAFARLVLAALLSWLGWTLVRARSTVCEPTPVSHWRGKMR